MAEAATSASGAVGGGGQATHVVATGQGSWRVTLSSPDTEGANAADGAASCLCVNVEWVAATSPGSTLEPSPLSVNKLFFHPPVEADSGERRIGVKRNRQEEADDDVDNPGNSDSQEPPRKASRIDDGGEDNDNDDGGWCDLHQTNHSVMDHSGDYGHYFSDGCNDGRLGGLKTALAFNQLPTEVQYEVFLRLPLHEVMATLPLVCSQWREMAYDETLWHSLHSLYFSGPKTKPEITWRKECGIVMRQLKRRKKVCEAHLEAERMSFRRREFLWAIKRGHLQLVRQMVESPGCIGIDVNQRDPNYDESPLMEAARSGHLAIVKYLLARGAEVDAVDRDACSALTHASIKNQPGVAKALLAAGADVNRVSKETCTPLMYAAGHGLTEVTKVLLDAGASVLMKDRDGFCPLMYAVTRENKEATRLILHSGADVNTASARGWTCLMHAAGCGDEEMFDTLVQHGAIINVAFEDGRTPLFFAATHGHHHLVKKLLVAGAEVNHRDEDGWTPLHTAVEAGAKDVVRLLLAHGADTTAETDDSVTPLALAANDRQMTRILRRALGQPAGGGGHARVEGPEGDDANDLAGGDEADNHEDNEDEDEEARDPTWHGEGE